MEGDGSLKGILNYFRRNTRTHKPDKLLASLPGFLVISGISLLYLRFLLKFCQLSFDSFDLSFGIRLFFTFVSNDLCRSAVHKTFIAEFSNHRF